MSVDQVDLEQHLLSLPVEELLALEEQHSKAVARVISPELHEQLKAERKRRQQMLTAARRLQRSWDAVAKRARELQQQALELQEQYPDLLAVDCPAPQAELIEGLPPAPAPRRRVRVSPAMAEPAKPEPPAPAEQPAEQLPLAAVMEQARLAWDEP